MPHAFQVKIKVAFGFVLSKQRQTAQAKPVGVRKLVASKLVTRVTEGDRLSVVATDRDDRSAA